MYYFIYFLFCMCLRDVNSAHQIKPTSRCVKHHTVGVPRPSYIWLLQDNCLNWPGTRDLLLICAQLHQTARIGRETRDLGLVSSQLHKIARIGPTLSECVVLFCVLFILNICLNYMCFVRVSYIFVFMLYSCYCICLLLYIVVI